MPYTGPRGLTPSFSPGVNAQRNSIATAMMNVANPPPQPMVPPQSRPMMGMPQMPPPGAPSPGAPSPSMPPPTLPLSLGVPPNPAMQMAGMQQQPGLQQPMPPPTSPMGPGY